MLCRLYSNNVIEYLVYVEIVSTHERGSVPRNYIIFGWHQFKRIGSSFAYRKLKIRIEELSSSIVLSSFTPCVSFWKIIYISLIQPLAMIRSSSSR